MKSKKPQRSEKNRSQAPKLRPKSSQSSQQAPKISSRKGTLTHQGTVVVGSDRDRSLTHHSERNWKDTSRDDGNRDDGTRDDGNRDDGNRDDGNRDDGTRDDGNRDDLIYGRHTVVAALENQRPLNRLWILPQLKRNQHIKQLLSEAKERGVVIDEVSHLRLDQLTQQGTHQGLVAQVGACDYLELDELIQRAIAQTTHPILIAVDGMTDPHNLGAIIRSAEALGSQGLLLPQRRCASVGATVAKVAAGALESLPIARVVNLNQALETLKSSGFWIYGLTLEATTAIQSMDLTGSVVLVIGSEAKGLSAVTQKHCDGTVKIPLEGDVQSLNASVAAGIGLYEIFRQRRTT